MEDERYLECLIQLSVKRNVRVGDVRAYMAN